MKKLIILLTLAFNLSAQDAPMKFRCNDKDTLYVSLGTDLDYPYLVFSCSNANHLHQDVTSITIGFQDGDVVTVWAEDFWVIYDKHDLDKLSKMPFDLISFDMGEYSSVCTKIKTPFYFINHLSLVEK